MLRSQLLEAVIVADCRENLYRLLVSLTASSLFQVQVSFAAVHVLASVTQRTAILANNRDATTADRITSGASSRTMPQDLDCSLAEIAALKDVLLWVFPLLPIVADSDDDNNSVLFPSSTSTLNDLPTPTLSLSRQQRQQVEGMLRALVVDSQIPLRLRQVKAVFGRRMEERVACALAHATATTTSYMAARSI
jgi:hypothetical protein